MNRTVANKHPGSPVVAALFGLGVALGVSGCDPDHDGYGSSLDCDNDDEGVNPGETEWCDGKDNDCDGTVDNAAAGCSGDDDDDATADDDDTTADDDDTTADDDDDSTGSGEATIGFVNASDWVAAVVLKVGDTTSSELFFTQGLGDLTVDAGVQDLSIEDDAGTVLATLNDYDLAADGSYLVAALGLGTADPRIWITERATLTDLPAEETRVTVTNSVATWDDLLFVMNYPDGSAPAFGASGLAYGDSETQDLPFLAAALCSEAHWEDGQSLGWNGSALVQVANNASLYVFMTCDLACATSEDAFLLIWLEDGSTATVDEMALQGAYPDGDGDGFGVGSVQQVCATNPNFAAATDDCDDTDIGVYPGATEVPDDGTDQDCSGSDSTICFFDDDGDGYGSGTTLPSVDDDCGDADESDTNGDCDDTEGDAFPGNAELCDDGINNDCDVVTLDLFDGDVDGSNCALDCDDANSSVSPALPEVCNDGLNNDCNVGTLDLFDGDSDGSNCATDCNDGNPFNYPGNLEICDGVDNDCNGVPGTAVPYELGAGSGLQTPPGSLANTGAAVVPTTNLIIDTVQFWIGNSNGSGTFALMLYSRPTPISDWTLIDSEPVSSFAQTSGFQGASGLGWTLVAGTEYLIGAGLTGAFSYEIVQVPANPPWGLFTGAQNSSTAEPVVAPGILIPNVVPNVTLRFRIVAQC